ncbi:hypothetical protein IW262DRAFT_1303441, partial [Armillaria fumosa]
TDLVIILFFLVFFASRCFYTWHHGFNGANFSIRARGLNNVCCWIFQIIRSIPIGLLLDQKSISHCVCAYAGWTVLV